MMSAWLKQGRDWLMLRGRSGLPVAFRVFSPKLENNFEAGFPRARAAHGAKGPKKVGANKRV
jgi:hypothetical protein